MAVRVGVNGFGRIGMLFTKAAMDRGDIEVVAANDLMPFDSLANLFKHDSTHGIWHEDVSYDGNVLHVGDDEIKTFAERDPAQIPWGDVGADIVVESTGVFTSRDGAAAHIEGGAKKVIISAPGKGVDATFVYKVNHETYDPEAHEVVSNASCTTNCLATAVKPVHDKFGITKGLMTTVHSYTMDQNLQDNIHKDLRRARAAAINIVPTTTGAAKAVALVMPELKGKFDGFALRVPTPTVSLVDFVVELERPATVEEVNNAFREAAEGDMQGILGVSDEPLVSSDYIGTVLSSIVDSQLTMAMGDNFFKVVAWYDNEWGYSNRLVDFAERVLAGVGEPVA